HPGLEMPPVFRRRLLRMEDIPGKNRRLVAEGGLVALLAEEELPPPGAIPEGQVQYPRHREEGNRPLIPQDLTGRPGLGNLGPVEEAVAPGVAEDGAPCPVGPGWEEAGPGENLLRLPEQEDRKSTRLNSSHVSISY